MLSPHRFLLVFLQFKVIMATIKGPPTAERKEYRRIVRLGEDVRLTCPMSGTPSLMFEWSKDMESIQEYSWTRFRINKKYLRISRTSREDSGTYHCKGTNGFGSEVVRIQLIVIDPLDFPHLEEGELPDVYPPEWTPSTRHNLRESYELTFGQKLHLSCEARGNPSPVVKWYFKGHEIMGRYGELILESASETDSGLYACRASNALGSLSKNVSLLVSAPKRDHLSDLLGRRNSLEKLTVEEGEPAALECKVSSPFEPNIKWLKRLEAWEIPAYADVIEVENKKFRFIQNPNSVSIPLREGEFVNTLFIPEASLSDSGMYYCFIALRVDYEFKNTYLTVIPPSFSGTSGQSSSSPFSGAGDPILIVIIILAIFVFILLLSIILCILLRRRSKGGSNNSNCPLPESPDVQENLMTHPASLSTLSRQRDKIPLPAPPPPPHSGPLGLQSSYYDSSSTLSTNYLQSGYYPPPPTSVTSHNDYEVPVFRPPSSRYSRDPVGSLY